MQHQHQNAQHVANREMQRSLAEAQGGGGDEGWASPLGMSSYGWQGFFGPVLDHFAANTNKEMNIQVEKENSSSTMTVQQEPWIKAMKLTQEQKEDFIQITSQGHAIVWLGSNTKEQIEFWKKLQTFRKSAPKDELPLIDREKMESYKQKLASYPSETSSGVSTNFTKLPEPETESFHQLPTRKTIIEEMGPNYIETMIQVMSDLNPRLQLKVGSNIFTTSQKPEDNLCYALATLTGLMGLDSVRDAANRADGPTGNALMDFMHGSREEDKYEIVRRLAEGMDQDETFDQEGRDASDFANYLLDRLANELSLSHDAFTQNIESWSTCLSCGGTRVTRSRVNMSVKINEVPTDSGEKMCIQEKNCKDGDNYEIKLMNFPDAIIRVVGSRRNIDTYKRREDVPYVERGMSNKLYGLKFVTAHLGETMDSGHFVTAFSNPADRADCILVDNGQVSRITPDDFDKFRQSAFIVGYDSLEAIQKPWDETVKKAMHEAIRKCNAREKLKSLKKVQEDLLVCKEAIETSYFEKETKQTIKGLLEENLNRGESLLKEEEEANSLADLLLKQIEQYKRNPNLSVKGLKKKAKKNLGLPENNKALRHILKIATSKVVGTGVQLLDHAKPCRKPRDSQSQGDDKNTQTQQSKKLICDYCKNTDIGVLFECMHCQSIQCKNEMKRHIEWSRCAVVRKTSVGFLHTPREFARGVWKNGRVSLSVIRQRAPNPDYGNMTQYILREEGEAPLEFVIKTESPINYKAQYDTYKGRETDDGIEWLGEGYLKKDSKSDSKSDSNEDKKTDYYSVKEEVKYKANKEIEKNKNFPIWHLSARQFSLKKTRDEITGEADLNLHGHPANIPDNLKVERELELIQVGSVVAHNSRMVLRRKGKMDEELTFSRDLRADEETPEVDKEILQKMRNNAVNIKYNVRQAPLTFEQFFQDVSNPNMPYKFENNGDNLCWVNTATQALLSILPHIAKDLNAVLKQDPLYSGERDLPKLLVNILANSQDRQNLNSLRDLVLPNRRGMAGPTMDFFDNMVKILSRQAPHAVEGLSYEKLISRPGKPCSVMDCNGTVQRSQRVRKHYITMFEHKEEVDGLCVQNCIERTLKQSEGPYHKQCTNGHQQKITANVTYSKRPDTIFMAVADNTPLEEESSTEVKFQGETYKAVGIMHHVQGSVGHHYCSLFDEKKGQWMRIDDYRENWKLPYQYSQKEKASMAGGQKLFDNVGVLCYKLQKRGVNEESETHMETEENDTDDLVNFHTVTESGQQVFRATNKSTYCYVNSTNNLLLGNPDIHAILRQPIAEDASDVEQNLHRYCHTTDVVRDSPQWKQLMQNRGSLNKFGEDTQEDAMEWMQGIWETLCNIEDLVDVDGNVIEKAPLPQQKREALKNILGHNVTMTTICGTTGCTKRSIGTTPEKVLLLDIADVNNKSVDSCLKAQLNEMKGPWTDEQYSCEVCKRKGGEYYTQQGVSDPKKCVLLQLNRFGSHNKKNSRPVIVEDTLQEGPFANYILTGAILHHGATMSSGHYTNFVRDVTDGRWYHADNDVVKEFRDEKAKQLLAKDGYILLYSAPGDLPAPLKGRKKRRAQEATKSNRTEGSKRRKSVGGNSTFNHTDLPPKKEVNVQNIPATSEPEARIQGQSTPKTHQLLARMNARKSTAEEVNASPELAGTMTEVWGFNTFRSRTQKEATVAIIKDDQKDVFVAMPTGSGKSLTFQLAALKKNKLAIVVSPLVALAMDQVKELQYKGVQARLLCAGVLTN